MTKAKKQYTPKFKLEMIKLVEEQGQKLVMLSPKRYALHQPCLCRSDYTMYRDETQHESSGNCWNNVPTERLFRSFKTEWIPKSSYDDLASAKFDVANYIVGYYSQVRAHSFNNYQTPIEKEKSFLIKVS